jgi:hypothetical protein
MKDAIQSEIKQMNWACAHARIGEFHYTARFLRKNFILDMMGS